MEANNRRAREELMGELGRRVVELAGCLFMLGATLLGIFKLLAEGIQGLSWVKTGVVSLVHLEEANLLPVR
eukprot:CAMPEP_0170496582 /NCGR_PEP_ID=MMETSP0208-20121228/22213_1 /TAXON_ID=197538 /ORGANISM="Strombidium inclinatum, Strain S3" /LENGTH=70 /DNA_ID=CAMNT_0010773175 /DNA_START=881 /DNA_END=1093 /DNA_ORIENTATION=-